MVEGVRLESVCTFAYRGFESRTFRLFLGNRKRLFNQISQIADQRHVFVLCPVFFVQLLDFAVIFFVYSIGCVVFVVEVAEIYTAA